MRTTATPTSKSPTSCRRWSRIPALVILATNFRQNMDDGFLQRLDFVIDFPFPEAEDRERIWRLLLPEAAPIDQDVDVHFLATQFKLAGGGIETLLAAAFLAAEDGGRIAMAHLVRGVALEYGKLGRLTLRVRLRTLPRAHQATERRPRKRPGVKRREHLPRRCARSRARRRRNCDRRGAEAPADRRQPRRRRPDPAPAQQPLPAARRRPHARSRAGGDDAAARQAQARPVRPQGARRVAERGRHPDWTPLPEHAPRSRSPLLVPRGEGPAEPRSGAWRHLGCGEEGADGREEARQARRGGEAAVAQARGK